MADLAAGGATQLGVASADYAPCADSGQNCANDVYAVSLPQMTPSSQLTWFQAQIACGKAAKRLPSNAEWQGAVVGTPDPGPDDGVSDCNTASSWSCGVRASRFWSALHPALPVDEHREAVRMKRETVILPVHQGLHKADVELLCQVIREWEQSVPVGMR